MNDQNLKFFKNCLNENNLSHAFLVETNNKNEFINDVFNLFLEYGLISSQNDILNNVSIRIVEAVNNNIDKDAIYNLQNFISTTSFDDKYKIYFIVDANLMNVSSANKLLKSLEEPPVKTIGFLICDDYSLILPTLKSRCQLISDYDDKVKDNTYDLDLYKELCNFTNMNFESYVNFKSKLLKFDKNNVINLFNAYSEYLVKNYDVFFIKVNDFLNKFKYNCNFELQLDKLFLERNK